MIEKMEWLNEVMPTNGNSSHIIKQVQAAAESGATSKLPWIVAALGSVGTHMLSAFSEMFWIVFFLWAADMIMGNLRALVDKKIPWSASRNLDGVIRLIAYGILGVSLVLLEEFILATTGTNVAGLLMGGGYAVCALAETKSLVRHWTYFIPGFSGFGRKLLDIVKTLSNDRNEGG